MPPGRKPSDPNVRIARTWSGSPPAPHRGPLARQQEDDERLAELARRLVVVKQQLDAASKKKR